MLSNPSLSLSHYSVCTIFLFNILTNNQYVALSYPFHLLHFSCNLSSVTLKLSFLLPFYYSHTHTLTLFLQSHSYSYLDPKLIWNKSLSLSHYSPTIVYPNLFILLLLLLSYHFVSCITVILLCSCLLLPPLALFLPLHSYSLFFHLFSHHFLFYSHS